MLDPCGDVGNIDIGGPGHAPQRYVIQIAAPELRHLRQPLVSRGRREQEDHVKPPLVEHRNQRPRLLGWVVHDQNAIGVGRSGRIGEAFGAHRLDRVGVAEHHDRRRAVGLAELGDIAQHDPERYAVLQRPLARTLDHRAVGHRIGERHAQFDDIAPGPGERVHQRHGELRVGVARRDEGNEGFLALLLERVECGGDAGHQNLMPDFSATVCMSLSPRPERLMSRIWSFLMRGAILAA